MSLASVFIVSCASQEVVNQQAAQDAMPDVSDWNIYDGGGKCLKPHKGKFLPIKCRKGDAMLSRSELSHLFDTIYKACEKR